MQHFLEIKFSFFCRSSVCNVNGESPIVLRVTYRKERRDVFTGLHCFYEQWDGLAQKLSSKDRKSEEINKSLEYLLFTCKQKFEQLKYSKHPFTLEQFVASLKGRDEYAPTTILEYLAEKVKELQGRVGLDITKATLQKYSRCIKHMKLFLKKQLKTTDIPVATITSQMLMDFFYFLRSDQNNSHNTSLNYIKCLKTVLMSAIKSGLLSEDPFREIKIAPKNVVRGFLSIDEINKLQDLEDLTEGLSQARDIFLFACYTGMAYIDVKQFSRSNLIKDHDGSICIHKHRHKTGILSIIPLLKPAERLLVKYSPTEDPMDFSWNVITNQKMNEHLKTLQRLAGIQQEMYFHLARHTFATTVTLSNGVPLETVSEMLGHTNTMMTKRYAKISGYKVKEDMKKIAGIFK